MTRQAKPVGGSRIPEFATVAEEAEFWDTHDTTEFEDEWEPVDLDVARPLRHELSVRFEGATFHRLVALAKQRGIPASTLAGALIGEAIERIEALEPVTTPVENTPHQDGWRTSNQ